jgi:DNA polymerase I
MNILQTALEFANHGIPVFPVHGMTSAGHCTCNQKCDHAGKHPILKGGYKIAITDFDQIRAWFNQFPNANLAIPTGKVSGLCVVDIDPRHGGSEGLEKLCQDYGNVMKETPVIVNTSNGGQHLYFSSPVNTSALRNATNLGNYSGIDFRVGGGYVVAPSSLHESGDTYRFKGIAIADAIKQIKSLPELPSKYVILLNKKTYQPTSSQILEGKRNDTLFKIGCSLRGQGAEKQQLLDELRSKNNERCKPPLSDSEIDQIVQHIMDSYPAEQPSSRSKKKLFPPANRKRRKLISLNEIMEEDSYSQFWTDPNRNAYVTLTINGCTQNHPLMSSNTAILLKRKYKQCNGKHIDKEVLKDFLEDKENDAICDGEVYDTFLRTARHKNDIYLFMGDSAWRVVKITADGWEFLTGNPPVKFIKTKTTHLFSEPDKRGDFSPLQTIFNLNRHNYVMLITWLVYANHPDTPYPVLAIDGSAGTFKSTLVKLIRMVIDPRSIDFLNPPKKEKEMYDHGINVHMMAYDNISSLKQSIMDTMSSISTGTADTTHEFYQTRGENIVSLMRPLVITSVNPVIRASDLLDRTVRLHLQESDRQRQTAKNIDQLLDNAAPKIFGAILNAMSCALKNVDQVPPLPNELRMMDFTQWSVAAEPSLGIEQGEFLKTALQNKRNAMQSIADDDLFILLIHDFMVDHQQWEGSAAELLGLLRKRVPPEISHAPSFPKQPNYIARNLNANQPVLKNFGVKYEPEVARKGKNGLKIMRLSLTDDKLEELSAFDQPHDIPVVEYVPDTITTPSSVNIDYQYIDTEEKAIEMLTKAVKLHETVGLDLETTGLDPNTDSICLLQIATSAETYIIDINKIGFSFKTGSLISQLNAVAHNAVFDMSFLHKQGISMTMHCTMISYSLLTGKSKNITLQDAAKDCLNIELNKEEQTSDWQGELSPNQLAYAAKDAQVVLQLHGVLQQRLMIQKSNQAYLLAIHAQPAVVEMKIHGMFFNREKHLTLIKTLFQEQKSLMEQWQVQAPNISHTSSIQIGKWIKKSIASDAQSWATTAKGAYSTTSRNLAKYDYLLSKNAQMTLRNVLLPLKKIDKQLTTFGQKLADQIHGDTQRLHPSFKLTGTITGRMSCANPNLQSMPHDPLFRELFSAPKGRRLVIADYSQMELRVAAILAKCEELLSAYEEGTDVHQLVASMILDKPINQVTSDERQLAKAVNFGLLFGQGSKGLQDYAEGTYGVEMTEIQAEEHRQAWFTCFPSLREWHFQSVKQAKQEMCVRTPSGRVRGFTSLDYNDPTGLKATVVHNTPVQGGAAEVLLSALQRISAAIKKQHLDAFPVAVVHDEIVLEVVENQAEQAKVLLEEAMTQAMLDIFPEASTKDLVEASIGDSWASK